MNLKTLTSVFFLSFLFLSASAQQVKVGVRAGFNFSEWDTDSPYKSDLVTGFHIGPTVRLKASNFITIEPSLLLTQKGTRLNSILDYRDDSLSYFSETKWEYKFLYLEIPVLVRFQVFSGFEFYLGPQFSHLIKTSSYSSRYFVYNEREHWQEEEKKGLKDYKIFDLALSGGIGYLFNNGMNVNLGYEYGCSTLTDEVVGKSYNRLFRISLGYYF